MDSTLRRQTLADLLHRSAKRFPDKTAIICGDTAWSYAEFDALCDRLAAGLAARGVSKGTRVAILSRNSHAFAALRFALARLGAVLVPINFMLKPEEATFILKHAGAEMLATDSSLAEVARAAAALDTKVRALIWLPSEEKTTPVADMIAFDELLANSAEPPPVELSSGDLLQIVYTSGTESLPKGAMLTHDAVIWQYVSCAVDAEICRDDLALHALPLYHCAQLDAFLGPAIYVGGTNVITAKPTPDNLLPLIERYRVTSFFAPPTVWISLLRSPLFDSTNLSSLQKGYYGASIMPVEVLREMKRRLPNVRLWNLYGHRHRIKNRGYLHPFTKLLTPAEQLAGMDPGGSRHIGGNRAGLHRRGNNPFLLRPRPVPAPLHRRDHLNLRLRHRTSPRISTRTWPNSSPRQGGPHRTRTSYRHKRRRTYRFFSMALAVFPLTVFAAAVGLEPAADFANCAAALIRRTPG